MMGGIGNMLGWEFRMQKPQWTRNERSSKRFQPGSWKNQEQKGGYSGSTKRQKASPVCHTDGHMSPQKMRSWNQNYRSTKAESCSRWHCKRRLWSLCSFCWTGLVCVPYDCCNNNGCNCLTTRLWRTSSWCSICLHSGKIGGCSQIAQNSKARMSRFLDTSCTTQMAQIMVKHWRPSGSSWATFCTVICLLASCGKDSSRRFCWNLDGIGNVCLFIENKDYSCRFS